MILGIFLMIWISFIESYSDLHSICKYSRQSIDAPEIFYVNLEKSHRRRNYFEHHLLKINLQYHRVSAVTPNQIYIPQDVFKVFNTSECKYKTSVKIPPRSHTIGGINQSPYSNYSVILEGLCQPLTNLFIKNPKELACTISHLMAIRKAVYSISNNRYALIMEDDAHFLFNVDFKKLISSAPIDFSILQLVNSRSNNTKALLEEYKLDPSKLWGKYVNDFGAVAYLIDRTKLTSWIDKIIYEEDGWIKVKLILVKNNRSHCFPAECCSKGQYIPNYSPCNICKPKQSCGLLSDAFIYNSGNTYYTPFPIITNGVGANISTIHQRHVEDIHIPFFSYQRTIYNHMMKGDIPLPPFLQPACHSHIDTNNTG